MQHRSSNLIYKRENLQNQRVILFNCYKSKKMSKYLCYWLAFFLPHNLGMNPLEQHYLKEQ